MLRALRWALALATIGAIAWWVLGPEKPLEVRAVVVERGSIEHLVPSIAAGTLAPREQATVVAEWGGTTTAVPHEAGTAVEVGEVVVGLEERDAREQLEMERLDLAGVEARLQEARIRRGQAARENRRIQELWKEGVFPRQRAEQAEAESALAAAEVRSLEARVQRGEAALRLAERRLEETQLRSPIAGILKTVYVEAGDLLAPRQPVFTVMDAQQLEVRVVMDEVDAEWLRIGQEARLHVEAYPERSFTGELAWIAPAVELTERATRGIEVRVELAEPGPELRVGMTVDVDVLVGQSTDALHVSTRAVTLVDEGPAVYLVDDGTTRLVRVDTGIATFDRTEILSGLDEGDTLVLETDQVSDGMRVTVSERLSHGDELE